MLLNGTISERGTAREKWVTRNPIHSVLTVERRQGRPTAGESIGASRRVDR
jgi:hypothetical protein